MMYSDIDFEYHSHLSKFQCIVPDTFNLTFNLPIILIHRRTDYSTEGPIHLYCSEQINTHASHGKGQLEIAFE